MARLSWPGTQVNPTWHFQFLCLIECQCWECFVVSRMINQCLQSVFTQVNFFIHNLAQIKWSGHDEGTLLSFIPKSYRLERFITVRCYTEHGIAMASLSVCLSLRLWHWGIVVTGWNSWKIILRLISLTFPLSTDPNIVTMTTTLVLVELSYSGPILWWPQTMTATNHDGHSNENLKN